MLLDTTTQGRLNRPGMCPLSTFPFLRFFFFLNGCLSCHNLPGVCPLLRFCCLPLRVLRQSISAQTGANSQVLPFLLCAAVFTMCCRLYCALNIPLGVLSVCTATTLDSC